MRKKDKPDSKKPEEKRSAESLREEKIDSLEERLYEKSEQIVILKHIIGLMGRVLDE